MNETFIIIWMCWLSFFVEYFFRLGKKQRIHCIFLLLLISLLPFQVNWQHMDFSAVYFVILLYIAYLFTYISLRFRDMIYICICCIGFVGLRFMEVVMPIWFILPSYVIHAIILYVAVHLVVSHTYRQFTICMTALLMGQVIYAVIVQSYNMSFIMDDDILLILLGYVFIGYVHQFILSIFIYRKQKKEWNQVN